MYITESTLSLRCLRSGTKLDNTSLSTDVCKGVSQNIHAIILIFIQHFCFITLFNFIKIQYTLQHLIFYNALILSIAFTVFS